MKKIIADRSISRDITRMHRNSQNMTDLEDVLKTIIVDKKNISYERVNPEDKKVAKINIIFDYNNRKLQAHLSVKITKRKSYSQYRRLIHIAIEGRKRINDDQMRVFNAILSFRDNHKCGVYSVWRIDNDVDIIKIEHNYFNNKKPFPVIKLHLMKSFDDRYAHKLLNRRVPSIVCNDKSLMDLEKKIKIIIKSMNIIMQIERLIKSLENGNLSLLDSLNTEIIKQEENLHQ